MPTLIEVDGTKPERPDQLSFGDYEAWLANEHSINLSVHHNHYDVVTMQLSESFRTSPFWAALLVALPNIDSQYLIDHKYPLLTSFRPDIFVKPWASARPHRAEPDDENALRLHAVGGVRIGHRRLPLIALISATSAIGALRSDAVK